MAFGIVIMNGIRKFGKCLYNEPISGEKSKLLLFRFMRCATFPSSFTWLPKDFELNSCSESRQADKPSIGITGLRDLSLGSNVLLNHADEKISTSNLGWILTTINRKRNAIS